MRSLSPTMGARLLACGVTLLFAVPLLAWLDAPVHRPQDEGLLLVYPELMLRGLLPHRDFLASYPPGNFALLAGAYQLFEPSVLTERVVGLIYRLLLLSGLVLLGLHRGPAVGTLCGVTGALLLTPLRLEAFSWIGGVALLVWAAVALQHRRPATGGMLLGFMLAFRLDLALAGVLLAASWMWLEHRSSETRTRRMRFLIALGCSALPLFLYFALISPHAAIQDLILGPILRSGPARRLPLSSLGTNSLRLLVLLVLGVCAALAAAWRQRSAPPLERRASLAVAALCIALVPQALQRLDGDHLAYACCVAGSLLPVSLDRLFEGRFDRRAVLSAAGLMVVATIGIPSLQLMGISLQHVIRGGPSPWIEHGERRLPARNSHEIEAFPRVAEMLDEHALPGDRLFIGPSDLTRTNYSDLHLYFLFPDLEPASYYLEMNPNSANRPGSKLAADLQQADWLLLSREWDDWNESNSSLVPGDPLANEVVRSTFVPILKTGVWQLHARRDTTRFTPSIPSSPP